MIRVGMPRTPYLAGVPGFSSILTLAIVILPANCWAISSSAGAIILQGPHHSAQKSTRTGPGAESTSASKLESETLVVSELADMGWILLEGAARPKLMKRMTIRQTAKD